MALISSVYGCLISIRHKFKPLSDLSSPIELDIDERQGLSTEDFRHSLLLEYFLSC